MERNDLFMKKFIKITNRCIVTTSRGKLRAPILTPFKEDVSIIYIMIVRNRAEVYEVLPDGRSIKLTTENFDKDNSGTTTAVAEKVKTVVSAPQIFTQVNETLEPTISKVTETITEEIAEPVQEAEVTPAVTEDTQTETTAPVNKKEKYSRKR